MASTRHLYGYMLLTSSGLFAGLNSGDKPTQLRDLAAALRKAEEVDDKLRALKNLEGALLAAPDELKHYAGELTPFSILKCLFLFKIVIPGHLTGHLY